MLGPIFVAYNCLEHELCCPELAGEVDIIESLDQSVPFSDAIKSFMISFTYAIMPFTGCGRKVAIALSGLWIRVDNIFSV